MLVRMPRGPVEENRVSVREDGNPFEAALRRDLASIPVISYESTIGGWTKRAFDLVSVTVTAPVWLLLMLGAALVAKVRRREPVFYADDRIGYGGQAFRCFHLRLDPPVAEVVFLPRAPGNASANDSASISFHAEDPRAKWRHAVERLPQLLNVLRGEMSLVGPAPLAHAELDPLKTAKRYYLSARPGVVGISGLVGEHEERAAQYKIYSLCWSLATDVNLLLTAAVSLYKRGELWRPVRSGPESPRDENVRQRARRVPRAESADNLR